LRDAPSENLKCEIFEMWGQPPPAVRRAKLDSFPRHFTGS